MGSYTISLLGHLLHHFPFFLNFLQHLDFIPMLKFNYIAIENQLQYVIFMQLGIKVNISCH